MNRCDGGEGCFRRGSRLCQVRAQSPLESGWVVPRSPCATSSEGLVARSDAGIYPNHRPRKAGRKNRLTKNKAWKVTRLFDELDWVCSFLCSSCPESRVQITPKPTPDSYYHLTRESA
ncbi:hypothetical protein PGT21_017722 [Puccinia graminis f. sp. tritici]|uniref:Uncharacterized protein n=1 Tax=Puccinia graminis f. sp. tritici TaxID=56615 RepID=A0A5B0NLC0_PUCGR|nr:hypothetical protein PGT21_017586 [Puccinia graminis f. sp. tritici]KAA1092905.1 hypothetical protein PGT21_017722 [Puccinia graminis f. sp. tritici]KAA1115762.1 hypothetical protein PGTUg99_030831 [Puccinia graminis f. sp. tritici]